jgi:hypothetical protein
MKTCKPVTINGVSIPDYSIDSEGNVWSTKRLTRKQLASNVSGNSPYPAVNLRVGKKLKRIAVHRLVCEAYHKFPVPAGVKKTEWAQTPDSVKKLMKSLYQVNHIDHDHLNFHADNLEWVTSQENSQKYQIHKNK